MNSADLLDEFPIFFFQGAQRHERFPLTLPLYEEVLDIRSFINYFVELSAREKMRLPSESRSIQVVHQIAHGLADRFFQARSPTVFERRQSTPQLVVEFVNGYSFMQIPGNIGINPVMHVLQNL
ncbi:MAG TPA: hypothetical protein VGH22_06155 [Candidatus Binatia bacterium]